MGKRERRKLPFCLCDKQIRAPAWEKGGTLGQGESVDGGVGNPMTVGWRGRCLS
jgi:hypothetical protein